MVIFPKNNGCPFKKADQLNNALMRCPYLVMRCPYLVDFNGREDFYLRGYEHNHERKDKIIVYHVILNKTKE